MLLSACICANVPGMSRIGGDSLQYVPAANAGVDPKFPGMFEVRNWRGNTGLIKGPGLGAV